MLTKVCRKCGLEKTRDQFRCQPAGDGRRAQCRECDNRTQSDYRDRYGQVPHDGPAKGKAVAIMELSRAGKGPEEIARLLNTTRSHVYFTRSRFRKPGELFPGQTRGRPPGDGLGESDAAMDMSGERCDCGLRVDSDHQPEACDMRGRTARLAEQRHGHWSDLQGEDYHW